MDTDAPRPQMTPYPAELLTRWFQVTGQITPIGDIVSFLNNPQRASLVIEQAQATPLQTDWRVGGFSRPEIVVPRATVQVLLVGDLSTENLRLLPRTEQLIVYTDAYAVNGHFHMGEETRVNDVFFASPGPFFPASEAEVYSVLPLKAAIGGSAPIVFLNKDHVTLFHPVG